MYAKLLVITLALAAIGGTLLIWRQQRLELSYQIMDVHREIRQLKQAIWRHETDAAQLLTPDRLQEGIDRVQIALENDAPLDGSQPEFRVVDAGVNAAEHAGPHDRLPRIR